MNGAGNKLFAGAALAMDQHRARSRRDRTHGLLQFLHRRAGSDDVVERVAGGGIAAQGKVLLAEDQFLKGAVHRQLDLIDQARILADVVGRASGLHRLHRGLVVIDSSDQDDGRVGRNAVRMAQHFDAVDIRHLNVGDDHVVECAVDLALGGLPGLHGLDFMAIAAQRDIEHFTDRTLVIADQNVSHAASLRPRPSGR